MSFMFAQKSTSPNTVISAFNPDKQRNIVRTNANTELNIWRATIPPNCTAEHTINPLEFMIWLTASASRRHPLQIKAAQQA